MNLIPNFVIFHKTLFTVVSRSHCCQSVGNNFISQGTFLQSKPVLFQVFCKDKNGCKEEVNPFPLQWQWYWNTCLFHCDLDCISKVDTIVTVIILLIIIIIILYIFTECCHLPVSFLYLFLFIKIIDFLAS